ncbi:MAG: hypothetical protein ACTHZX_07680, partial [Microbacterium sp.]
MEWIRHLASRRGDADEASLRQRALSAPELVTQAIEAIGPEPTAWAVDASAAAVDHVRERERSGGYPTASSGRVKQASEAAFLHLVMALAEEPDDASEEQRLPLDLVGVVREGVRQGLPLDVLLNRVWAIHTATRDEMFTVLQQLVPAADHAAAMRQVGDAMSDYAQAHARRVSLAYEEEQRAWRGRRTESQRHAIEAVVAGAPPPDDGTLDVQWMGGHQFAMSWVEERSWFPDVEVALTDFANGAAGRIGAERVVIVEHEGRGQLWWNAAAPLSANAAALVANSPRPEWLHIALGPQGTGVEGFRDAVRGAELTERVAHLPDSAARQTWLFDEVGHLALFVGDRDAAAWFVHRELGPLAGPGTRLSEIRDTVRLYLSHGNSRVVVAKEL